MKQNILTTFLRFLKLAATYLNERQDTREGMNKTYCRSLAEVGNDGAEFIAMVTISGNVPLFRVSEMTYCDGAVIEQVNWLATGSWAVNGQLLELGGHKICIIDPVEKMLYIERHNQYGQLVLDEYKEQL